MTLLSVAFVLEIYQFIFLNEFSMNTVFILKYSDRQAWANSVDPDQTPQNAASDQGLHCLKIIQQFFFSDTSVEIKHSY